MSKKIAITLTLALLILLGVTYFVMQGRFIEEPSEAITETEVEEVVEEPVEKPEPPTTPTIIVPEGELIGEAIIAVEGEETLMVSVNGEESLFTDPVTLEAGRHVIEAWSIDEGLESDKVSVNLTVIEPEPELVTTPKKDVINFLAEIKMQVETNNYAPETTLEGLAYANSTSVYVENAVDFIVEGEKIEGSLLTPSNEINSEGLTYILEDKGENSSIYDLDNQNIVAIIQVDGTIVKNDENSDLNAQYGNKVEAEMQSLEEELHLDFNYLHGDLVASYSITNGSFEATAYIYENSELNSYSVKIENSSGSINFNDENKDGTIDHQLTASGRIDYDQEIKDISINFYTALYSLIKSGDSKISYDVFLDGNPMRFDLNN